MARTDKATEVSAAGGEVPRGLGLAQALVE
jgi:hypothetical protein